MLYTALYMAPSTRTQVYLTTSQRRRLDAIADARGVSMATVVRDAVDAYLLEPSEAVEQALEETFGAIESLEVPPRSEWRARWPASAPRRYQR